MTSYSFTRFDNCYYSSILCGIYLLILNSLSSSELFFFSCLTQFTVISLNYFQYSLYVVTLFSCVGLVLFVTSKSISYAFIATAAVCDMRHINKLSLKEGNEVRKLLTSDTERLCVHSPVRSIWVQWLSTFDTKIRHKLNMISVLSSNAILNWFWFPLCSTKFSVFVIWTENFNREKKQCSRKESIGSPTMRQIFPYGNV